MFYAFDLLGFTFERLWQHRTLVLWTLIGLTAAAALALSLVMYVDAVSTGLLDQQLGSPPYAFRYRYLGSWNGTISQADYARTAQAITADFTRVIGLPVARAVSYVSSGLWSVSDSRGQLGSFTLSSMTGADDMIDIVSGSALTDPGDGSIPVMLPESMFETMGLQVGDTLTAARPGGASVKLRVEALWQRRNPDDPAWIFPARFFDQVMLLPTTDLWQITNGVDKPVDEAAWQVIFDGSGVKTSDVGDLLARIDSGQRIVSDALPGVRLEVSPTGSLQAFVKQTGQLTQQLAIVVLPVGGLALYFVISVAGLLVGRQMAEDAALSSRGMSRRALLALHGLMWLILAGAALALGLAISPLIVQIVGRTSSFLRFDNPAAPLAILYSGQALAAGAITVGLAAGSGLILSWRASRQNITSYRLNASRSGRAWWQRAYLDLLLLIPACYVLYTLWRAGGLRANAESPFDDPLAFVGPTLFSFSLTLLFLRIMPFVLRIGAAVVAVGRGIPLLMALRELTRSNARYRGTLLMMCFTLSLTGFTASMASTLDRSLADTVDYRTGADLVVVPAADAQVDQSTNADGSVNTTVTGYNTLPADDLLSLDGVQAVSRVGRYTAQLMLPAQHLSGIVMGVDRGSIAAVTRYRDDYSDVPLADLFNRLAGNRTGIILSQATADQFHLQVGQTVKLQISALNTWSEIDVPIVGLVKYFPTLDPSQGFFGLMSIDVIFETVGSELPHDLWLSLKPNTDLTDLRSQIAGLGYPILTWNDPQSLLQAALSQPLRRGILGFLSVGFVAAIALTLIGAIIQNAAAFRAQAAQLGALRAMGLSGLSVAAYLLTVQTLAASSGAASGTLIGLATTLLYLPLLDFSSGLPPYLVRVAWNQIALVYAAFAGVLIVVILTTTLIMSRQNVTTLVKLGE